MRAHNQSINSIWVSRFVFETSRYLSEVELFSAFHGGLKILKRDLTSTVAILQETSAKSMY